MTDSLLDIAHGSGDRMRFFNAFTSAELFLLLDGAPEDDVIEPSVLETDEGRFVLVFDREERLAEFVGRIADRIALEGRDLVTMLAGQGIGLAFNPDVAPSSSIITPEDLDWLHATLAAAPQTGSAVPTGIRAPDAPPAFLDALNAKFATATGKAQAAYLVSAQFDGGRSGHLVAIIGARADAEPDLARDVAEAAQFAGLSQPVDVAFLDETDPRVERFARHGLRFDLPEPEKMQPLVSPGMDPAAPPRLK